MQLADYSFEQLPFSKLFKTYVADYDQLSEFYETNPFDKDAVAKRIKEFSFTGDREKTADALTAFNEQFDIHENAQANIQKIAEDDTLAVVTGQQLGIYGGPLYTVLKIISSIHLANRLEQQHGRTVVPVFWLADEDHDYDEVRELTVLNRDETETFELPSKESPLPTVAEMPIPEQLDELRSAIRDSLYDTDFSDELWDLLDSAFQPGRSFSQSFGIFVNKIFSKHGLVLAGSNNSQVKKMTANLLKKAIADSSAIRETLEQQSEKLAAEYHQQVTLYDSNLFYLDEDAARTKISRNGDGWATDAGTKWVTDELLNEIDGQPERFSPNVFLRPILQDALLPTIGYVAGPGETAYYAQMKHMYSCFNLRMPIIFPRLSATLVEPAIDRIINELPFELHEYDKRIEDLESEYVEHTEQRNLEELFGNWKDELEQLVHPKKEEIADIDATLEGAVEKSTSAYFNELDKLKGKVYRAVKKQDEIQLKRIRRIKANLFPNGNLQERVIATIFFMNKYGIDIWDELLEALDESEEFDQHKLVYL